MDRQRSRVEWLHEGYPTTAFIHAKASACKGTNNTNSLLREYGSKCESQGEIKGLFHEFYEHIFSSEPCHSVESVLDAIAVKVTAER
jgi:hypothetical protein